MNNIRYSRWNDAEIYSSPPSVWESHRIFGGTASSPWRVRNDIQLLYTHFDAMLLMFQDLKAFFDAAVVFSPIDSEFFQLRFSHFAVVVMAALKCAGVLSPIVKQSPEYIHCGKSNPLLGWTILLVNYLPSWITARCTHILMIRLRRFHRLR